MRILEATEAHRGPWLKMRMALWPECPEEQSSEEISAILAGNRQAAFLAQDDDGSIVAFVEVSTRDYVEGCRSAPVGYMEGIYVRPEYRKKGIGTQLVRAAERWAARRGCREMGSDAEIDNAESISFHLALGFREMDRLVMFLKEIGEEPTEDW